MPRFYKEDVWPIVVVVLVVAALAVWGYVALVPPVGAAAADPVPFDHSNCQYPNRVSNPPDGCDNSDPARPECMKIGIEDCDLPRQDGSIPISTPSVDPAASQSVTAQKPQSCVGN